MRLVGESRSRKRPIAPGKTICQVCAQLLHSAMRVSTEFTAGADGRSQRQGPWAVGMQWPQQPGTERKGVGENLRFEPGVLVASRAVAAAQFLTCRSVMITTSIPAASSASTTGPSGRSIAT